MEHDWEIAAMMMTQFEFVSLSRPIILKPIAYLKEWISWFSSANFLAAWNLFLSWKLFESSIIVEYCCLLNWGCLHRDIFGAWAMKCAGWFAWSWIPALVDSSTLVACKSRLSKKSLLQAHHFVPLVFERIIFLFRSFTNKIFLPFSNGRQAEAPVEARPVVR